MSERQSDHRMTIESTAIAEQQRQSSRGQMFGFIIGLAGMSLGTIAAIMGEPKFGAVLACGTVVSLVGVFVTGQHLQHRSLRQKAPPEPSAD